ncbi:hypothetical protein [Croceicoccus marinus]|uniref:Uncharacterized protein n=1 Tax=Croceicoccus marinus TaxID=450378 RepID=A0A7G6VW81_9SPHN|nr:hypothetical protein [Croceicoccus marinus]QNE05996.1 hypothetical protein H4O24_04950 [Croceicoccus marinus]
MLSLSDAAAIEAALRQPLSADLKMMLAARLQHSRAQGLGDLTYIVVIECGDAEADVKQVLGWSPLMHPIDGTCYDDSGFQPYWAWLKDLGGWYELIHPVGNDGFAYILLIEKGDGPFAAMCGGNL